ncbi:peroxidase 47 [Ananas comosus]|uniref:Peroxidase n=1 Tax=Ananas comosus TaxID=4615 RepID=A0A6P5F3A2_ANACO|nr:peroxidase 47 [Ananas comosus]
MKSAYYVVEFLVLVEVILRGGEALSMNYYGMSCPFVEPIVRIVVNQALHKDPTLAAGLLRLHFHDCFVQGCDASVLLDSTSGNTAEKDSPVNLSLRGYEVIDQAKKFLEMQCPGIVSCADIVALAARDAVFWAGGPYYDIVKGRKDGTRSKQEDTFTSLPAPTLNTTGLINVFSQHGFTVWELVALSGGHTLGVARCSSFKSRLSSFDSTHDVDPSMDPTFAKTLLNTCSAGDSAAQPFDATTNSFDNLYFSALQKGDGVLFSDQTLYVSPQTQQIVNFFAMNQAIFFFNFQQGMMKMGSLDVKEGSQGEVRANCRKIN